MMPAFDFIARALAERIGYCLAEGMLVAAFAGLLLRALPHKNAGTRFAVWFSALLAIAALPLFGRVEWAWAHSLQTEANGAALTLPGSWAWYVFAAWAAIAGVALLRVGAGFWQLWSLRRSCGRIDVSTLDISLRQTLTAAAGTRLVAICVSDRVHAPVAIGFTKPAVVIPADLMHELSTDELRQVLLHELAHLRRWDDWTNLVQKLLRAILFFHPAVWWVERKISLERESACDDAVLKETASPRAYARCLAHLAEKNLLRRSAALAQAAVSRLRHTTLRVARILDGNRPAATTRVWKPGVALVAASAAGCLAVAVHAPKLVAFQDPARPSVMASAARANAMPRLTETAISSAPKVIPAMALSAPAAPARRMIPAKAARLSAHSPAGDVDFAFFQRSTQPGDGLSPVEVKDSGDNRVISTETFVLLVNGSPNGMRAAYQISVWRVTILERTNARERNLPKKVT